MNLEINEAEKTMLLFLLLQIRKADVADADSVTIPLMFSDTAQRPYGKLSSDLLLKLGGKEDALSSTRGI